MSPFRPTAGTGTAPAAAPSAQSPAATQAYGQPVYAAANSNGAHGSASASAYPAATSAYGQPSAYPGRSSSPQSVASPASAYGAPSSSAYGSAYPSAYGAQQASNASSSPLGRTNYGMPALSSWQPSTLPVSPWSTISPGGVAPLGGGVDTTTILRADLKALKRSRLKGWGYLFITVGVFGGLGYLGVKQHMQVKQRADRATAELNNARQNYEATLTKLGVSESEAQAAASNTPGAVVTPPGLAANAASTKLADDLKKQLTGIAGLTVEGRGDRVVVGIDQAALFEDSGVEVSLGGYKALLKLKKVLPNLKDRRIVISVPGEAKKGKSWNLAIGRSLVLGRYVIDDANVDPHRVTVSAPGAPQGRGGRNIEITLEPMPETTKS